MNIKNIKIGKNYKTFLIAEVGLSHEGSIGIAFSMIDSAKEAGADAVKFQMHLIDVFAILRKERLVIIFVLIHNSVQRHPEILLDLLNQ